MKKQLTLIALAAAPLLHAGLFSHDKAYYDAHPAEAKAKFKACDDAVGAALLQGNIAKAEAIEKDAECKAAKQAYFAYRQKKSRRAYEKKRQERAQVKAKQKAAYEAAYNKAYACYRAMDYASFVKEGKTVGVCGSGLGTPRVSEAKCRAYKAIRQYKEQEAVAALRKQYQDKALFEYETRVCKNAPYGDPTCDIARKALEAHQKEVIQAYLNDKAELKRDFNACFHKLDALHKAGKFNEAQSLQNSYRCKMAAQAALKLNIYGYFQPME